MILLSILIRAGLIVFLAINLVLFPELIFIVSLILMIGVFSMGKRLTAGVLQGASYTEVMRDLEFNGEYYDVEIRALTNSEATEVEELTQEGIFVKASNGINGRMNRSMNFDTKANFRGRKKADIKAVALGTLDPSITEEVVEKEFPPKFVKEIANRIKQISGIGNQEEVEEFSEGEETPSDGNGE